MRCVIGEYCHRHSFVHGFEAEELRQRLQKLGKRSVNAILDDVDARDSLAYMEALSDAGVANQQQTDPAVVTQGADHHEPTTRVAESESSSLTSDVVVDLRAQDEKLANSIGTALWAIPKGARDEWRALMRQLRQRLSLNVVDLREWVQHKVGCWSTAQRFGLVPAGDPAGIRFWRAREEGDPEPHCTCGLDAALVLLLEVTQEETKTKTDTRIGHPDVWSATPPVPHRPPDSHS